MGAELDVDGPRPAVAWVTQLPGTWTTPRERLLLLVLALDTFDREPPFTAAPSMDELAARCGEGRKTRVVNTIRSLTEPGDDGRPPLLEVEPGRGRRRSIYRLMTEHGPALWSQRGDYKQPVDNPRSGPDGWTTRQHRNPNASSPNGATTSSRSGRRSGPPSGPNGATTPYPLPPYGSGSRSTTGRAHEECQHKRYTVDGDCLDCGRQIFAPEGS